MIKRILAVIFIVLMGLMLYVPQKAYALNLPTSYSIVNAVGFQNLAETGDILILVKYSIVYPSGGVPAETVSQAWNVRWLYNGVTEITAANPFSNPYFENGYGDGAVGLYLSASDVVTQNVTFGSSNYTVSLERNPAVETSWNGTPPPPVSLAISWNTSTDQQNALLISIITLANSFRTDWGLTFNLQTSNQLTSDGENYFLGAIPNLRQLCPRVFSSYTISPTYRKRTFNLAYAATLRNQWVGTFLDLTAPATDWNLDPIWLYGGIWTIVLFAAVWGVSSISNSNRGIYWTVTMGVAVGSLIGFLPWLALGVDAIIAVIIILNELLYKRTLQ